MEEAGSIAAGMIATATSAFQGPGGWLWPGDLVDTARYPRIGVARSNRDLFRIGRLRYELFATRDGRPCRHADHAARILLEPIDRLSLNFSARAKGRCVATVRATRANDAMLDPCLEQVVAHADLGTDDLDLSVVLSRLAVPRSMAASVLIPTLFRSMLRGAHLADVRFCLAAAPPTVIPLLALFGFRSLHRRRPYFDEAAGWISVLILDLHDRKRLAETRSPLLGAYDTFAPPGQAPARAPRRSP